MQHRPVRSRSFARRLLGLLYVTVLSTISWSTAATAQDHDPIDLLVLYTPRTVSEHFDGSVEDAEQAIEAEVAVMNETFVNSHLPADFRYELVGIEPVCFEERENIRLDLQWLHAHPEVARLREASGADFVLLITGTSNYGGMARAIYSSSPNKRTDAFAVLEAFGLETLSAGHELGHVLGCAHNPEVLVLPDDPGGNHGYLYWENEPYFRTLMAYYSFPGENCQPCQENQLNAFSSPDIWYMFAGAGNTLNQTCWPTDLGSGAYQLACPDGTTVILSAAELAAQGIPIGDAISNNREQVLGRWDIAAAYFHPPLATGCNEDCAALHRVGCTTQAGSCGGCRPGFAEGAGLCQPAVPAQPAVPLADGCFTDAGAVAADDGAATPLIADLGATYAIARLDLHFSTYDETDSPDWTWTVPSFMPWSPPPPPDYAYSVEVSADGVNFTALASGTQDTPESSIYGHENGHTMMRRAWMAAGPADIQEARWIRVQLSGSDYADCDADGCPPQVGLHEVRAFGEAILVPQSVGTKVLRLLDDDTPPIKEQKRRLIFVSKATAGEEDAAAPPSWDSDDDPSLSGAQLEVYRVDGEPGQSVIFDLPASAWKRTGSSNNPGYRYKDGAQDHGPIRKIVLKNGLVKIVGRGDGLYTLGSAPQTEMALRLSLGTGTILCAAAPAREPQSVFDSTSRFHAVKNSPPPPICPTLP